MKNLFNISLCLLALGFFSCGKEDPQSKCEITKEKIAGTYQLTKVEAKPTGVPIYHDITEEFFTDFGDPCEADDHFIFEANGTFLYEDAGTKCDPPSSSDLTSWTLVGTTIVFEDVAGEIQLFDCKKLVIVVEDEDEGISGRLTFTKK